MLEILLEIGIAVSISLATLAFVRCIVRTFR